MKLTIFTLPKPRINGHISTIQQNALSSWAQLPQVQIIVMGKGQGIAELARSVGALYLPQIKNNKYGTPLLDDAFRQARKHAISPLIMYSNADMIYGPDLLQTVDHLPQSSFLGVGSRWDLDLTHLLAFQKGWWPKLVRQTKKSGHPHAPVGSDYFIYAATDFKYIPPFAVGRVKWDNWMIYESRRSGLQAIDCSQAITAIHQNHDYTHQLNQGKNYLENPEARYNEKLALAVWRPFTLRDANWEIRAGIIARKSYTGHERLMIAKDVFYGVVEKFRRLV